MRFRDRTDAGRKLAAALSHYRNERPIVMALPRGGVPVAAEVARTLNAPLGIILVRKIGAPSQPELALGAVVDGISPSIVRNEKVLELTRTSAKEFDAICKKELMEIERRRRIFLGDKPALDPNGRTTIVIDDGVATGATMRVALQSMRMRKPKKLVLAVPVAASDAIEDLRNLVDDVVCLANIVDFRAVGLFYDDFRQLEDRDVTQVLERAEAA